jgi:hypothetical protein
MLEVHDHCLQPIVAFCTPYGNTDPHYFMIIPYGRGLTEARRRTARMRRLAQPTSARFGVAFGPSLTGGFLGSCLFFDGGEFSL